MSARTKARKRALDVLFEAEQRGINVGAVLEERLAHPGHQHPLPDYAQQIVRGVLDRWLELNSIIEDASTSWSLERMPAVDRNLIRIGAWEILCNDEVATAVAIDEACDLAAELSTDESPTFVNGVLGRIARDAPAIGSSPASGADDLADD